MGIGRPAEWLIIVMIVSLAAAAAHLWSTGPAKSVNASARGSRPVAGAPVQGRSASPFPIHDRSQPEPAPAAAPVARSAPGAPQQDRVMLARDSGAEIRDGAAQSAAFAENGARGAVGQTQAAYEADGQRHPQQIALQRPPGSLVPAASVRYGGAERGEVMGRGAGPVYNLRGNRAAASGELGALIQQAGVLIQQAQSEVDKSTLDERQKEEVRARLHAAEAGLPGR